mmetsp:Transcript_107691/g.335826  ORF Transcript_107691/g.335826 Transcript_107691/m.335826 type:complete len:206 (-) Transcript_107691:425-1042(-)
MTFPAWALSPRTSACKAQATPLRPSASSWVTSRHHRGPRPPGSAGTMLLGAWPTGRPTLRPWAAPLVGHAARRRASTAQTCQSCARRASGPRPIGSSGSGTRGRATCRCRTATSVGRPSWQPRTTLRGAAARSAAPTRVPCHWAPPSRRPCRPPLAPRTARPRRRRRPPSSWATATSRGLRGSSTTGTPTASPTAGPAATRMART